MAESESHRGDAGLVDELRIEPALRRMHPKARSWTPLVMITLLGLAALSWWFGYLDEGAPHPTLKIGLAMSISVLGLGTPLLVRLMERLGTSIAKDVLATTLALLSVAGGLVHFAVVQQHMVLYWAYGWFFIVVGAAQLVWAVLVLLSPSRLLLWAGSAGNLLIAITWVITRTYGDFIGPSATMPEKVGFGDVVSTAFEVLIVVGAVVLARWGPERISARTHVGDVLSGPIALVLAALTILCLYSSVGGRPFVSHVG